ncbi:hypothetical protein [Brevibacillus borstelensis]|uniref:hypothetical protein n=1 Tax=Brevibacillus borstelensis TaxID=45462 RepID=UPI002E1EFDAC|nr:hypothetical protein [Brevibacillus borstelensis]
MIRANPPRIGSSDQRDKVELGGSVRPQEKPLPKRPGAHAAQYVHYAGDVRRIVRQPSEGMAGRGDVQAGLVRWFYDQVSVESFRTPLALVVVGQAELDSRELRHRPVPLSVRSRSIRS